MPIEERVFIAGAGPVGLVAAANLLRRGVPVTVFEAGSALAEESRASTFHPPTLDMLDEFGAAGPLIAQGLKAPQLQYRTRDGVIATFDFAAIADATRYPFRVQAEQFKLTRILHERLGADANFRMEFDARVSEVEQDAAAVHVALDRNGSSERRSARWLIGADGARSDVRRALGIEFAGFTWPERFLVVSTPFDFRAAVAELTSVTYVADPVRWHFFLEIPGGLWRVMFPLTDACSDEEALSRAFADRLMVTVVPGIASYEIAHTTLYKVHQRVAKGFRAGRVFLAGDAAHVNNPLGGMGMNGGIHDAVNLTGRLAAVFAGAAAADELDRYERQRRAITLEHIEKQSIENKRNLECANPDFAATLRRTAEDPQRTRDYLLRVAMIASLRRAAELG
ncbi:MAG TPA: FAD-dependent monooxygenase [Xanthobacteraceae bacterium]|jgi:3-(3-hydroxy-phenyl)propionate hydroxylase|nr:FAD-dependent monooxygenase [Xanthobacteraceae bacterium]